MLLTSVEVTDGFVWAQVVRAHARRQGNRVTFFFIGLPVCEHLFYKNLVSQCDLNKIDRWGQVRQSVDDKGVDTCHALELLLAYGRTLTIKQAESHCSGVGQA